MTDRTRAALVIAAAALAAVWITYGGSLHFDLFWDDYGALRPRTWSGLLQVWHDSWDAGPPFYRPLATWYYALCFEVFGLNAWPLHVVSLVLIGVAAWLTGLYIWRETSSVVTGAGAAAIYAAHPGVTYSSGPWFASQFHLLATICALGAMTAWRQRRATTSLSRWWPVAAFVVIGFLIKEDTVMVAVALLVAQAARARWIGDLPPPSRRLVVSTALLLGGLIAWRYFCLGGMGRYWPPALGPGAINLLRGPYRVLLWLPHESRAAWPVAAWTIACWLGGAIAFVRARSSRGAGVWITGAALLLAANAPLMLVSNMSRYHLLTLGAVCMIAGGAVAIADALRRPRAVLAWSMISVAGVFALSISSRDAQEAYRPCTPTNLERDQDIVPWDLAPPEVRAWLVAKAEACANGSYRPLVDSIDQVRWLVSPGHHVVLVNARATEATLTLRAPGASAATPAVLSITTDAGEVLHVTITTASWQDARIPLGPGGFSWLHRMYRVDARLDGGASPQLELGAIRLN